MTGEVLGVRPTDTNYVLRDLTRANAQVNFEVMCIIDGIRLREMMEVTQDDLLAQ